MIEITQEFGFDAAHYLDGAPEYRRMHGHSFYVEVTLRGEPDPQTGFLRDFGEVDAILKSIRAFFDLMLVL
jgi:6-pyruvoyltetrahydropterin/6-carboxytetrahydropterin synthase